MNTRNDPRGEPAWRLLLLLLGLILGAGLLDLRLDRATGDEGQAPVLLTLATAVSYLAAWLAMARFRWLTVGRGRVWLVVLGLAWLAVLVGGGPVRILGYVLVLPFVLRWQHGLQLMPGRWRALAFLALGPLLVLSIWSSPDAPDGRLGSLLAFARFGVQVFLATGLLTLLFGMRLHFLRLRPKLFVTGVLVGLVPLGLMMVFSALLLYASLGGSRANRTADLMVSWAEGYQQGRVPAALGNAPLVWSEDDPDAGPAWMGGLVREIRYQRDPGATSPPVLDLGDDAGGAPDEEAGAGAGGQGGTFSEGLADGLAADQPDESNVRIEMDDEPWLPDLVASADTTFWLMAGQKIWLTRFQDPGPGRARVEAIQLDDPALAELSRIVRTDLRIRGVGGEQRALIGGIVPLQARYVETAEIEAGAGADTTAADASWWRQPRIFGGGLVLAPVLGENGLHEAMLMLELETSLRSLAREFFNPEQNVFNIAIMVTLGLVAVLLLLAGLMALVLSLRITGGIVEAVKALHAGTRRIAAGDLDTRIEVQSEDEFGDLADSFNEMTDAVKQGREDAVARERLQQEMDTARRIQERLLPHDQPALGGWDVTGVSIPSLQVGGDYFDFVQPGGDRLGIAIGDVSGKGVPAALLMSNLQACLKGQVLHPSPVAATVSRVNDLLAESTDSHMFATFLYGELDGRSGRFVCTNAGHEPALVVRHDGSVEWLSAGGLLLGMFAGQHYDQVEVELRAGDVLVLYTDGITEAGAPLIRPGEDLPEPADEDLENLDDHEDEDDELFGERRLADVVVAARERSASGIREAILAAVQRHLDGRPQGDDITLVVLKRNEDIT
jgi:serine phosphatase RsbU (regulator of sigma subunit)